MATLDFFPGFVFIFGAVLDSIMVSFLMCVLCTFPSLLVQFIFNFFLVNLEPNSSFKRKKMLRVQLSIKSSESVSSIETLFEMKQKKYRDNKSIGVIIINRLTTPVIAGTTCCLSNILARATGQFRVMYRHTVSDEQRTGRNKSANRFGGFY